MFLDHGLWERRLHFAVFQSAHLEDYIKCGLVDVAREEAGSSFIPFLTFFFFYTYIIYISFRFLHIRLCIYLCVRLIMRECED